MSERLTEKTLINIDNSTTPKEKTKAKKRYLKAKKDRKKKRKANSVPSAKVAAAVNLASIAQRDFKLDSDTSSDSDGVATEEEGEALIDGTIDGTGLHVPAPRPQKRQKMEVEDIEELGLEVEEVVEARTLNRRSPTARGTLPSFPLPALPDAPSKSVLALQGVDQALVNAEIIDPSTVWPLNKSESAGLSEKMTNRLLELGITELFAVQTALLPFLLPPQPSRRRLYLPYDPPRDVCVSAPTGSGKTLAYVLPIVELLSSKIVTRLRALVVLPTRDLVTQVRETFEAVCKGSGLKIGTATGQHSFAHEQAQLVGQSATSFQGGVSKVDILLCTPGRLMDHLNGTPNFSLQHLRFLVIDEADRLLTQSFQDWLAQVLSAIRPPQPHGDRIIDTGSSGRSSRGIPQHDALAPAWRHLAHDITHIQSDIDKRKQTSCQKLLFSATLTRDPSKIAVLDLHDPKYFVVQSEDGSGDGLPAAVTEKFTMPPGLSEHMVVCESSQKPLILFHLIHAHSVTNALVFTKSVESATRLVRLFEFFEKKWASAAPDRHTTVIQAYSSELSASERKSILDKFKAQEIGILVCSDLISRGIDISHVSHVVSYDAAVDMRKYVHRVGRTARAGRSGDAWSLVEEQEARHFKSMLTAADHLTKVRKLRVSEKDTEALTPFYQAALSQLKEVYARASGYWRQLSSLPYREPSTSEPPATEIKREGCSESCPK